MSLEITRHHVFLSTAPQASPEDMLLVAKQGFASVMNNRPDFEHDADQPTAQSVADAAHVAGMDFYDLPFSASRVTPELLVQFAQVVGQAKKPILIWHSSCFLLNRSPKISPTPDSKDKISLIFFSKF